MELETLARCNLCKSDRLLPIDPVCNICKCQSCGYIFDNPRPTFDEIKRFYSRQGKYDSWLAEERERDHVWKRRLKKMMKHRKAGTLLDVGAGIGQFLHHAKPYFTEVYGTEISESAVDIAKDKYGLNVIKGDLGEIQFSGIAPFDNITLFHVLEHVPNPKRLVEELRSLLSEDGVLVIAVPNDILSLKMRLIRLRMKLRLRLKMGIEGYSSKNIGILGLRKITLDNPADEIHFSHFTPGVLKQLLENSGFHPVESSLDSINVKKGMKYFAHELYYVISLLLIHTLDINIYDTIRIVAQKGSDRPDNAKG